jgi:hypothetical protein
MKRLFAYTNFMKKTYLILTALVLWASTSSAGLLYNYPQLLPMDLDQMNSMVKKKVREFKKDGSTQILKEAVQAVYSRPNDDGMIEKIITPLRNELDENDNWEPVMESLVQEAIGAMKNPKAFKPVVLNTYAVFLENVIADYKPFADKPGHERKMIEKIRDAKIEMTKAEEDERKLRTMSNHKSPSEIAASVMEDAKKVQAEEKAATEKESADEKTKKKK